LARFRRDEGGSIIVLSLFLFIAMLAFAGLAIDFMRVESTRIRLQSTADRAVLAAASLDQTRPPREVVEDYFEKAGLGEYLGNVSVTETKAFDTVSFRSVTATVGASLKPIFLGFAGLGDDLPIIATSAAEEGISELEISLVLDVSGSMGSRASSGSTKIAELREAAKDFVYHMQCNSNARRDSGEACEVEEGRVSISIVPYSEQVNAGPFLTEAFNVTDEHHASNCVTFDAADFDTTAVSGDTVLKRTGHFDARSSNQWRSSKATCPTDGWREITPFMEDYTEVYTAIDALSTGGNTSIDVGMKWGTMLLDPAAQSVVTSLTTTPVGEGSTETVIDPIFNGRPYAYDRGYNMKVIVLMTDGENTTQYYLKDAYRQGESAIWHYRNADGSLGDPIYSVYDESRGQYRWVRTDGRDYEDGWHNDIYAGQRKCNDHSCWSTGVEDGVPFQLDFAEVWQIFPTKVYDRFAGRSAPVSSLGTPAKNNRLSSICAAAKNSDMIVFTIGFEVGEGSTAETEMRDCASNINNFFLVDDGTEDGGMDLEEAFGAIASSINHLRLTQ